MNKTIDVEKAIAFFKKTKANQAKHATKYRKAHPDVIKKINKRYYEKKKLQKEGTKSAKNKSLQGLVVTLTAVK